MVYMRVLEDTWKGYEKELLVIEEITKETSIELVHSSVDMDSTYAIDAIASKDGTDIFAIQIKPSSYLGNTDYLRKAKEQNTEKNKRYQEKFGIPVFYAYYGKEKVLINKKELLDIKPKALKEYDENITRYTHIIENIEVLRTNIFDDFGDGKINGREYNALVAGYDEKDVAELPIDGSSMFIISNKNMVYGASMILTEVARQMILEKIGEGSVWVLPSSVHELIIISTHYCSSQIHIFIVTILRFNSEG